MDKLVIAMYRLGRYNKWQNLWTKESLLLFRVTWNKQEVYGKLIFNSMSILCSNEHRIFMTALRQDWNVKRKRLIVKWNCDKIATSNKQGSFVTIILLAASAVPSGECLWVYYQSQHQPPTYCTYMQSFNFRPTSIAETLLDERKLYYWNKD